jgi:hypothetical protein
MKIIGIPNTHIIDYDALKEKFVLDEKGEFITDDKKLFEWARKNKPFLKFENNAADDKPAKEAEIRAMAKEKGIDHYWNMKIENLLEKLKEG